MKNAITLTAEQRKELVTDILADAIIFERTIKAVDLLQRAANPNANGWDASMEIRGIINTYALMGLRDFNSFEAEYLTKTFMDAIALDDRREQKYKFTPRQIAEDIFAEWESFLNNLNVAIAKSQPQTLS